MSNTRGSGKADGAERLARVSYLPGVVPPSEPEPLVSSPSDSPLSDSSSSGSPSSDSPSSDSPSSKVEAFRRMISDIETEQPSVRDQVENRESDGERSAR